MPNLKDIAKKVTAGARAKEKAVKSASSTASKAASKAVANARIAASELALTASKKLAPPTQKGKGVKRALVAAGAVGAAVVAAASVSAGRARKRTS